MLTGASQPLQRIFLPASVAGTFIALPHFGHFTAIVSAMLASGAAEIRSLSILKATAPAGRRWPRTGPRNGRRPPTARLAGNLQRAGKPAEAPRRHSRPG